jgi:hypothetical protein
MQGPTEHGVVEDLRLRAVERAATHGAGRTVGVVVAREADARAHCGAAVRRHAAGAAAREGLAADLRAGGAVLRLAEDARIGGAGAGVAALGPGVGTVARRAGFDSDAVARSVRRGVDRVVAPEGAAPEAHGDQRECARGDGIEESAGTHPTECIGFEGQRSREEPAAVSGARRG